MDNRQQAKRDFILYFYAVCGFLVLVGIVLEVFHRDRGGTLALLRISYEVVDGTVVAREVKGDSFFLLYEYSVSEQENHQGGVLLPRHFESRYGDDLVRVAHSRFFPSVSMPSKVMGLFEKDRVIWLSSFGFFGAALALIFIVTFVYSRFMSWLRWN